MKKNTSMEGHYCHRSRPKMNWLTSLWERKHIIKRTMRRQTKEYCRKSRENYDG